MMKKKVTVTLLALKNQQLTKEPFQLHPVVAVQLTLTQLALKQALMLVMIANKTS